MKKFVSKCIKVGLVTGLLAQLAFAAEAEIANSSLAEPLYLSLCGVMLLAFGMLKNQKDEKDS